MQTRPSLEPATGTRICEEEDCSTPNMLRSPPPTSPMKTVAETYDEKGDNEATNAVSLSTPESPLRLLALSASFFLCMIVVELAMEAVTTSYSHLDSLTSAITLFQFGFCIGLGAAVEGPRKILKTFPKSPAELTPYIKLSSAVFGATALATHSLHYVSFPTKVVFKSVKLIPTMIVSTIMNKTSKYGALDYLSAAMLCAGAAGFSYGSGKGGKHQSDSSFGILLLMVSITCDAIVPNFSQKLMAPPAYSSLPTSETASPPKASPSCCIKSAGSSEGGGLGLTAAELMANVNGVGFIGLLVCMLGSGSLLSTFQTAASSPMLLFYLTSIGLGLSTAVLAYNKLIKSAGSVVAVAVATLRKVATILLSYIIFPKAVLSIHIISGLLVLCGIVLSSYTRMRNHR
jgi:drug/metabolite transporter (DMT)-like permease